MAKTATKTQGAKLTPMLRQYLEVKAEHPDALLFYRMGDFYELFFDDAVQAAPILEVALTARHKNTDKEVPMCGVPHHALDTYLGRAVRAGRKVAICDQVENPAEAKGLVKREVTRIVTPGTVSQPDLLDSKEDNLLACVVWQGEEGAGAFLEMSTGTFFLRRWPTAEQAIEDLAVLRPREILSEAEALPPELGRWLESEIACLTPLEGDRILDRSRAADVLRDHFGASTLRGFGLTDREAAVIAAAGALEYARATQFSDLSHIHHLAVRDAGQHMVLDATTLTNLDIFRNQREGGKRATLLSVLDETVTAGGGRLLRDWLRRPLRDPAAIGERHDGVDELTQRSALRQEIRSGLAQVGDIERLLTRAVLGTVSPREAGVLRDGLRRVPALLDGAAQCQADLLVDVAEADPLDDLAEVLERTLVEQPPPTFKNGGVIAEGIDAELDRCRSLARDSKQHILALEARERQSTGISSLKIRYNRVFGYYLEVTKANQHLVPEHYIRKQTLVNAERYITPEIKDLEEEVLSAEETQLRLEEEFFEDLRLRIVAEAERLRQLAGSLAVLDVVAGLAERAVRGSYCRPKMRALGEPICIREGRHPVVEVSSEEPFVPNDFELDGEDRIIVLTGPNMGGKSTYLRQVALIVLMAQTGSFVPADEAEIGVVDRIFTRVGASDDLARGESTFMVEMIETANILHHATANSLVILDEVGRGTSTFDGMSLAWAIVEHLHGHHRPKALFATHYHELTELASLLPGVINRTLAVKEWQDKIVFLRRIVDGSADKSYGLHVARLAGLPSSVIDRASEVLENLEKHEYDPVGRPSRGTEHHEEQPTEEQPTEQQLAEEPGVEQLALFTPPEQVVAQLIQEVAIDDLTPLAALNLLASLKSRLGSS